MKVINAKNKVLGRLCTEIASALLREQGKIIVVNAGDVIITGTKEDIIHKFQERTHKKGKGNPQKNAKYPRYPDKLVKFAVRGMLPRNARGNLALKKLRVYIDVPEPYQKDLPKEAELSKHNGMKLSDICVLLGAKLKK